MISLSANFRQRKNVEPESKMLYGENKDAAAFLKNSFNILIIFANSEPHSILQLYIRRIFLT
jgi:hypothetical protein